MRWPLRLAAALFLMLGMTAAQGVYTMSAHGSEHQSVRYYPAAITSATDAATGITLNVAPDGRHLVAVDASGKTLWDVDILADVGEPYGGFPVIRHIYLTGGGSARLAIGKGMSVDVDLKTGKATLLGED